MQVKTAHKPGQMHINFKLAQTVGPLLEGASLDKMGNILVKNQRKFDKSLRDAGFTKIRVENSSFSHDGWVKAKTMVHTGGCAGYAFVVELVKAVL